ncbi:MAG: hypothetical protein KIT77_29390 [Caldilinea sp.]|nr:hypothetical protein [Caldilinea sp.]
MSLNHNLRDGQGLARLLTWAAWVLLNVAGVLGGYFLALGTSGAAARAGQSIPDRGITALTIPLIGLLLGLGQWLVVRRHLRRPAWWVAATFVGWIVPIGLEIPVPMLDPLPARVQLVAILVAIGLGTGIAQALVLRGPVRREALWVAASLAGWLLLAATLPVPITGWAGLVWVGAAPALVTGAAWALGVVSR